MATALIREKGLDACNLSTIARQLDVSVMALYTYFPNKDSLIEYVASAVFTSFDVPDESLDLRAFLEAWLRTLISEFRRRPEANELMHWTTRVPGGWHKLNLPMIRRFHALGLRGRSLDIVMRWFGLMSIQTAAGIAGMPDKARLIAGIDSLELDRDDRAIFAEIPDEDDPAGVDLLIEFSIETIVAAMERLISDPRIRIA